MILEWWMIVAFVVVFALGMVHMYNTGSRNGSDATLKFLQENNIIVIDGEKIYSYVQYHVQEELADAEKRFSDDDNAG
jgi:hypothetical protein